MPVVHKKAVPKDVSPFQANVLEGKVALITGGGSGIGLEITRQLGLHGASVVITGRRKNVLADSCETLQREGIRIHAVQGDVRKPEDCAHWVAEAIACFGGLDILVNCAAGNFLAAGDELSAKGFRTVLDIDALGTFAASRAAVAELRRAPGAAQAHASAAKAAVDSLTRSLALEWGEFGVRVNGVAPGPIGGTAGLAKLAGVEGSEDEVAAATAAIVPLGRVGAKWDIAMGVVYLCSPAARFVSGHTLVVDGGAWLWRPPAVPRKAVSQASRGMEAASRGMGLSSKL